MSSEMFDSTWVRVPQGRQPQQSAKLNKDFIPFVDVLMKLLNDKKAGMKKKKLTVEHRVHSTVGVWCNY